MIINLSQDSQFATELTEALLAGSHIAKALASEGQSATPDEDTIIIADLGSALTHEHKKTIHDGMDGGSTLVLRNCKSQDMSEFALFGVDAESVVLKSIHQGRKQDIVVLGGAGKVTVGSEPTSFEKSGVQEASAAAVDTALASGSALPVDELEAAEHAEAGSTHPDTTQASSLCEQPFNAQSIAHIVEGLNFRARAVAQASKGLSNINASQASGSIIFTQVVWNPYGSGGQATLFGSYDIELAAVLQPLKKKVIKITSRGSAAGATPKWDDVYCRGYFTERVRMVSYPGSQSTLDTTQVSLPTDWRRTAIAPETANAQTTYTTQTGWTIGASIGAEIADDPKVTASLSASYSSSNSTTETIEDFRAKNKSGAAACDWEYEYSVVTDNWQSMFINNVFQKCRIKPLARLSKSTMFVKNEAMYDAPPDTTGTQDFMFYLEQTVCVLWEEGNWASAKNKGAITRTSTWEKISVNLGMVRHP